MVIDGQGTVLADLVEPGHRLVAVRGGRGGRGNAAFVSPKLRAPAVAEQGEYGPEGWFTLELKLAADAALIGFPNAGKSTLISTVSAAKPKVADYPFTTLQPHLGVVSIDEREFVLADIPGLIEGAADGKGLGLEFLRHVERARVLVILLDPSPLQSQPVDEQLRILLNELERYLPSSGRTPPPGRRFQGRPPGGRGSGAQRCRVRCLVSAATRAGLDRFVHATADLVDQALKASPDRPGFVLHRPVVVDLEVQREGSVWVVEGQSARRAVAFADLTVPEAARMAAQRLARVGVDRALLEAGAEPGDDVRIGDLVFEFQLPEQTSVRRPIPPGAPPGGEGGIVESHVRQRRHHPGRIEQVADIVAGAISTGYPTVLVTSGAVASGLPALGLSKRPQDVAGLQVAAAVGQSRLMERYTASFDRHNLVAGQVLLTKDVLSNRDQYLNARTALDRMLTSGIVPIVNENDTVVVGDLQARGQRHPGGRRFPPGRRRPPPDPVRHRRSVLGRSASGRSRAAGCSSTHRRDPRQALRGRPSRFGGRRHQGRRGPDGGLVGSADGGCLGGRRQSGHPGRGGRGHRHLGRPAGRNDFPARKLWIAFGLPSSGSLTIDAGAVAALVERAKSLLPVGVIDVKGSFPEGAAVEVLDPSGQLVAKGLVRIGSHDLTGLMGKRSQLEAIHRDDLVVLR